MLSEIQIKQTEVPNAGVIVVTAKLTAAVAKPFETFSMCNSSGYASPIAYFATETEALAAHDHLVAALQRREEFVAKKDDDHVASARQRGIDVSPPSPAPQLTGKSHDEMVEIIQAWFFENFEDPAESTPYESAEGGYQYIWGGPYDANEELQSAFLDIPLDDPAFEPIENAIKEAVEEIEQHGWAWAPNGNRLVEEREP